MEIEKVLPHVGKWNGSYVATVCNGQIRVATPWVHWDNDCCGTLYYRKTTIRRSDVVNRILMMIGRNDHESAWREIAYHIHDDYLLSQCA